MMRRSLTIALVFWVGGLNYALGCTPNVASVTAGQGASVSESASASAGTASCAEHACCQKTNGERGEISFTDRVPQPSSNTMACCTFAGQAAEAARKVRPVDDVTSVPAENSRHYTPGVQTFINLPARRARLPDRRDTYMRCCVFLI